MMSWFASWLLLIVNVVPRRIEVCARRPPNSGLMARLPSSGIVGAARDLDFGIERRQPSPRGAVVR
jgi:hypothetical protein